MEDTISFQTVVKIFLSIILLIFVTAYIVFQARFLIVGPQIVLTDEYRYLQNEKQIYMSGETHNISHLWLNERQIYTDASGKFKEALVLENGYTTVTLRAEDRYGRETKVTRNYVYLPASFAR